MPRAPEFWRAPPGAMARALAPLGWAYGAVAAARMTRAGARLEKPVICVGNLTAGGAGKTPTTIAVARILRDMRRAPFVVSRGYGGTATGPLRVDAARHDAAMVGDEPLEIAAHAPVIVSRDRVAGARQAIGDGADVVLLDDGLQNPSLAKALSLAVIDGEIWFGNGYCLPAGPLRAPVAAQAPFIDAVIIIGGDRNVPPIASPIAAKPTLRAQMVPDATTIAALTEKRILAFAGIGRPEKFFATLRAAKIDLAAVQDFGDHESYTDVALIALAQRSRAEDLHLVTTMKDFARIGAARAKEIFADRLTPLPAELVFENVEAARALLANALQA